MSHPRRRRPVNVTGVTTKMNPTRPETVITNPPIPYNGQIPSVKEGTIITVRGQTSPNVTRFVINLNTSALPNCDVALHMNPRFEGTFAVVRNSYKQGEWGPEERGGPPFPLMPGTPFTCSILVTNNWYQIAFNNTRFCEYVHRISKDLVSYIMISGEVTVSDIRVGTHIHVPRIAMEAYIPQAVGPPPAYSRYQRPGMMPGSAPPMGGIVYPAATPLNVPCSAPLPRGLNVGTMIFITGKVNKSPDKFAIDLEYPSGVAFHFNPRFVGRTVVCNTMCGDSWGPEEVTSRFPFDAQHQFAIIILCEQDKIKVTVDHRHLLEYKHRIPLDQVRSLRIHGNISLTDVHLQLQ